MTRAPALVVAVVVVALLAAAALAGVATQTRREAIEVQFHLRSAKHSEAEVEAAFVQRSTPGSVLFRQHLSVEQLTELVGASDAAINAAVRALTAGGATQIRVSRTRDIVSGVVPRTASPAQLAAVGLAPADFDDAKSAFRRPVRAAAAPAGLELYSVLAVGRAAAAATDATAAAAEAAGPKKKPADQFPGMTITPADILARYKVPKGAARVPKGFTQGVAEFEESRFRPTDITTFSQRYNLTVPEILVRGPNVNGSSDNTEGTLDVEYITAVSGGIPTWWISQNMSSTQPGNIDFAWWCDEVLSLTPEPPSVVSISWGLGDYNYALDVAALEADNRAFRKLGTLGISVFAASGDSGPGARSYISCSRFMPSWPASSPYVTSVGATYANSASDAEESVNFSGGGFSDTFATPPWQAEAVKAYLARPGLPATSFFNTTGRGYPDVSALGTNYMIYFPSAPGAASMWGTVSGTSCASPTFAAVISRINAERRLAGKPTLGFLNPTLYRLGKVGQDVVKGASVDQDCFGIFTLPGFPALQGWDAVSGLGTPDYEYLRKAL